MSLRNALFVLVCGVALTACIERPGLEDAGHDAGCIGACGYDAGTDAGTDAGIDGGAQVVTIADLHQMTPAAQHVLVNDAIVSAISRIRPGTTGCNNANPGSTRAEFWVVDPTNTDAGFFIWKYCSGPSATALYSPDAGDRLRIDGYLVNVPTTENRIAGRPTLSDSSPSSGANRMSITLTAAGQAVPAPVEVGDAGEFGNALGGSIAPNFNQQGSYIHVKGPLEVTEAFPHALMYLQTGTGLDRNGYPDDAGLYAFSSTGGILGFEVTGGILVVDSATRSGCDWRSAADAGSRVVFPDGIRGIWDTYAMVPFCNPFPACLEAGYVPGGQDAGYTLVVYPQNCGVDLDGGIVPP